VPEESLDQWLAALASRTPAPGGGAAAALAAATAAALVSMVASYTTGERWADRSEGMKAVNGQAATLRLKALDLVEADARAFGRVSEAYAMPKITAAEQELRERAIQEALTGAVEPPRAVGDVALAVLALAEGLVEDGNPNVISDIAVASSLARAAIESAAVNIEINRALISDPVRQSDLEAAIDQLEGGLSWADSTTTRVRDKLKAA
jgi:formiminotetrahydrofolate cyclodeaminase